MKPRDTQKAKLYRAERQTSMWDQARRHETMPEVKAFLERVLADPWFKATFPTPCRGLPWRLELKDGRRTRIARGGKNGKFGLFLSLPRWSRNELVILHELSHALQPEESADHGQEFASIYSRLVFRFIGPEAFRELTDAFRANRVRYVWMAGSGCGLPPTRSVVIANTGAVYAD